MSTKKRRGIADVDVRRWIREGHGQGEREKHKPWVKVRDVRSEGTSFIVPGLLGRVPYHYLSVGEFHTHHLVEFAGAIWVYDQRALLPREETHEIAIALRLPPRYYPGTRVPLVLSTDLYVEFPHHRRAFWVKDAATFPTDPDEIFDLLVTLAIETEYWRRRGVQLHPVLKGRSYNVQMATNLVALRHQMVRQESDHVMKHVALYEALLPQMWTPYIPRIELHRHMGHALGLTPQEVMVIEGRLIWTGRMRVDLNIPWELEQPLALTPMMAEALPHGVA